jgi:hypothetical protein
MSGRGAKLMLERADYRFWLVFVALAVAVLVACSSSSSSGTGEPDGSTENVPDSMTHS